MAPDAEKIRQRTSTAVIKDSATETTQLERVLRLDQLRGNEVCIDGVIYDLASFKHPGGESIFTFGGNDVTVTYKMIHPYHTEKHLEKMKRLGKVSDYVPEYKFGTDFEKEIKSEVFKIVRRGREFGTLGWFARAAFYITLFFSLQFLWATGEISWQLAVIYGLSQSLIGLNVQHDANHGAASKNHIINDILGLGADFIGGSKWLWIEQHWTHHSYTNHKDQDPDSFGAEPFMLFNDYPLGDSRRKWFHQFQGLFYPLVLSGYWLSSILNPEIFDLKQRGALGVGLKMESDYIKKSRKYAVFLRFLYIFTNIVLPFYNNGLTWNTFGLIILMGASDSLGLALLFALSHNFEDVDRDPTKSFRETGEPVCWYKSQVETSCTYGGFLAGAFTGGLNFQVEHHLFPRMSSAWYPFIAPKVREICKKHGVKYAYYPWIFQNWISTVKYIHAAGTGSNWANPFKGNL